MALCLFQLHPLDESDRSDGGKLPKIVFVCGAGQLPNNIKPLFNSNNMINMISGIFFLKKTDKNERV
jgi:hypothetical protein